MPKKKKLYLVRNTEANNKEDHFWQTFDTEKEAANDSNEGEEVFACELKSLGKVKHLYELV